MGIPVGAISSIFTATRPKQPCSRSSKPPCPHRYGLVHLCALTTMNTIHEQIFTNIPIENVCFTRKERKGKGGT